MRRLPMRPVVSFSFALLAGTSLALAADLDLTSDGASGSFGDGKFVQTDPQPTGTGVIDPFVRLQKNGSERGFNTDHSPLNGELGDIKAGAWTHSLQVSDLVPVIHDG